MLYKKNIICISSIDWDFIWQGHQEIMSVLAKEGNRVLFIENTGVRVPTIKDFPRLWKRFLNWKRGFRGIRKESDTLYIYSPLVLPFPYSKIAVKINRYIMLSVIKRWMKVLEFHNPIVWSFLPTALALDLLNEIEPIIFIYYCIDDFVSSSRGARKIKKAEEKIIKRADLIFTTSHNLKNKCSRINKNTHLFPFGVSIDHYNEARGAHIDKPVDMRGITAHPIVGYVGGIHKWVDLDLLKKIALSYHGSIVLVGPLQVDLSALKGIKNIYILGKKEKEELPNYVKFFDVGIIPYLKTTYTNNVYPTKINEYLAMGKPVISTKIPEVVALNNEQGGDFINLFGDEKDFRVALERSLSITPKEILQKRIDVANSNSWTRKIEKMCGLIETRSGQIQSDLNADWLRQLKGFYIKSRKKTIKIVVTLLILYLLMFYSPFVWLVASPLMISQVPQKADAIVVFGGGVGETGSPGKSTMERSRFSVDLYNRGFANNIIYSSGYTWKYNDAENMKLFALSMGVPDSHVILEQRAGSTYENVKYVSQIMKEKGFKKIVLVSSPYNMRRASLVFKKMNKTIVVIYVPVEEAQFYHKTVPVKIEQIRGIVHEYLGIIYYFFKGYI